MKSALDHSYLNDASIFCDIVGCWCVVVALAVGVFQNIDLPSMPRLLARLRTCGGVQRISRSLEDHGCPGVLGGDMFSDVALGIMQREKAE